jgi:peroxiredoxin Q/BCP
MRTRLSIWSMAAGASVFGVLGCSKDETAASASASTSAAVPPPISTTWQTAPGHLLGSGEHAPDFEAIAHTGQRLRLSEFLSKPVVVLFYSGNAAPDNLTRLRQIRDAWLDIVPGVSMVFAVADEHNVEHRDTATRNNLPFLLVSDADGAIRRAFGVEQGPVTFVIQRDRSISAVLQNTPAADYAGVIKKALSPPDP